MVILLENNPVTAQLNGFTCCYATRQGSTLIRLVRHGIHGSIIIDRTITDGMLMITVMFTPTRKEDDNTIAATLHLTSGEILNTEVLHDGAAVFRNLDPEVIYTVTFV